MIKLKPCAHCGAGDSARLHYLNADRGEYYVRCIVCGIRTANVEEGTDYVAKEKAAELWNTRANRESEGSPLSDIELDRFCDAITEMTSILWAWHGRANAVPADGRANVDE